MQSVGAETEACTHVKIFAPKAAKLFSIKAVHASKYVVSSFWLRVLLEMTFMTATDVLSHSNNNHLTFPVMR